MPTPDRGTGSVEFSPEGFAFECSAALRIFDAHKRLQDQPGPSLLIRRKIGEQRGQLVPDLCVVLWLDDPTQLQELLLELGIGASGLVRDPTAFAPVAVRIAGLPTDAKLVNDAALAQAGFPDQANDAAMATAQDLE